MACPFCATGQGGLTRNLSTAEILEQVARGSRGRHARRRTTGRLSNIVFMGMGEPLANYNRVLAAVRRIIAPPPHGFGISARSVTVSTVGLAPAIRKLADERPRRDAGAVAARPRRRVARHAGARQQPVERRRSPGRRTVLRRRDRSPGVHRVRAHPRRQRPAVARRPARQEAARRPGSAGARQRHPAEPDAGQQVGRQPQTRRAGVRQAGPRARASSCTVRDTRGREIAAACGQLAAEG